MPDANAFIDMLVTSGAQPSDAWLFDGAAMLGDLGLQPDPWQVEFIGASYSRALLLCSRRSGKTTSVAIKALHHAMFSPPGEPATVLVFAPAGKQSTEFLHILHGFYKKLGEMGGVVKRGSDKVSQLDFANGSRIIPLTSNPDSAVGFTPTLIIIDEAARTEDELYKALAPMRALGKADLIALSTPYGKRGWFYNEWIGKGDWCRVRKTADDCPRIQKNVIEEDRLSFGDAYVRQEYFCSFETMAGLVYPEFESALVDPVPLESLRIQRWFAGVDFGFHNPSAVIYAGQDFDDTLWIFDEIYGSRMTDDDLIVKVRTKERDHGLKTKIEGYFCDSEAAGSIEKMRRADLPARKAIKKIDLGIRAVAARIRTGRLKVFRSCTNVIREAGLYRYHTEEEQKVPTDNPVKEHDHAMDAMRYLVAGVDRPRDTTVPITWRSEEPDEKDQAETPKTLSPSREEDWEQRENRRHRKDSGWEDWR